RHTRFSRDWSSDVCSSDLDVVRQCLPAEEVLAVVVDLMRLALPALTEPDLAAGAACVDENVAGQIHRWPPQTIPLTIRLTLLCRSEERRVGNESRTRNKAY